MREITFGHKMLAVLVVLVVIFVVMVVHTAYSQVPEPLFKHADNNMAGSNYVNDSFQWYSMVCVSLLIWAGTLGTVVWAWIKIGQSSD